VSEVQTPAPACNNACPYQLRHAHGDGATFFSIKETKKK